MNTTLALLGERFGSVYRLLLLNGLLAYGSCLVLFLVVGIPVLPLVNAGMPAVMGLALWLLARERLFWPLGVVSVGVLGHSLFATWLLG